MIEGICISLTTVVHQYQQKHDLMVAQCSKLESSLVKEREQRSKAMQDREHLQVHVAAVQVTAVSSGVAVPLTTMFSGK